MKEQAYDKDRHQDHKSLTTKAISFDLMKECHNELTLGEIVSLKGASDQYGTVEVGPNKESHNCYSKKAHRQAGSWFDNKSYHRDLHRPHNIQSVMADLVNKMEIFVFWKFGGGKAGGCHGRNGVDENEEEE
ncbi:hypothetical protein Tco_0321983 [Tanacetum coccineum]